MPPRSAAYLKDGIACCASNQTAEQLSQCGQGGGSRNRCPVDVGLNNDRRLLKDEAYAGRKEEGECLHLRSARPSVVGPES